MTTLYNDNRLSLSRSIILHFWQRGHRYAAETARITKICECTICYNIAKIREEGSVEHRGGGVRPRKIAPEVTVAIGQWIRRNNEITTPEISEKLRQH